MLDQIKAPAYAGTVDYDTFLLKNRIRVNRLLNSVLWWCILAGPAIALCVRTGVIRSVSYQTCLRASLFMTALAAVHYLLVRMRPAAIMTSLAALFALDCLLLYVAAVRIGVYLAWTLVPLLSLLFCDKRAYYYTTAVNFVFMTASLWIVAPYYTALRADYESATRYFAAHAIAYAIENGALFAAGHSLCKLTQEHYRELIEKNRTVRERETQMKVQMNLLDSMAEIYGRVNLVDFERMTELSMRDGGLEEIPIAPGQTHTHMNQGIMPYVAPDVLEDFLYFTNISTLQSRMRGEKLISGEFIHTATGWFRAQYITVDAAEDGTPQRVIYTTQDIDAEKRREEHLLRISMTDELTRLYNRHSYEEDVAAYEATGLEDNFAVFSIDVNGLKETNDSKGHAAGDELLLGAADCLRAVLSTAGRVYRTGGDEFVALLHTDDCAALREALKTKAGEWHGDYNNALSYSVGYARHADAPGATIRELEKIADVMMYEDKERHYQREGVDRRRRRRNDVRPPAALTEV